MNKQRYTTTIETGDSRKPVLAVYYSQVTGQAMWLYRGTRDGIKKAYYRARKREVRRQCSWKNRLKRREQNIRSVIDELLFMQPILTPMSSQQRKALRELKSIATAPVACGTPLGF